MPRELLVHNCFLFKLLSGHLTGGLGGRSPEFKTPFCHCGGLFLTNSLSGQPARSTELNSARK